MSTFYRQCVLKSNNSTLVAWLDDRGLKPGVRVTLKDSDDKRWWTIESIGEMRMPEDKAKTNSRSYRHHREVTDI